MSENIKTLQSLLNCEIIPIDKNTSKEAIIQNYLSLLAKGKTENFIPMIVTADDILIEKFELDLEDEDLPFDNEGMKIYRDKILKQAEELYADNFYQEEKEELINQIDKSQIDWEEAEVENPLSFSSYLNYADKSIADDVVIIKIPTNNPYEVFAWLPMGGFNDCPSPAEMVAMAKYWHEKHGAEPATLTYDIVEFYVPNPTTDKDQAIEIAMEQYFFDVDIVEQGVGDVASLVASIYRNKQWYFWWD